MSTDAAMPLAGDFPTHARRVARARGRRRQQGQGGGRQGDRRRGRRRCAPPSPAASRSTRSTTCVPATAHRWVSPAPCPSPAVAGCGRPASRGTSASSTTTPTPPPAGPPCSTISSTGSRACGCTSGRTASRPPPSPRSSPTSTSRWLRSSSPRMTRGMPRLARREVLDQNPESTGNLGLDPIGAAARLGGSPDLTCARGRARRARCASRPCDHRRRPHVSRRGATAVEEVGYAVARASRVRPRARRLRCRPLGLVPAHRVPRLRGQDQFLTIAALRALRRLWARVGEVLEVRRPTAARASTRSPVCGCSPATTHGSTSCARRWRPSPPVSVARRRFQSFPTTPSPDCLRSSPGGWPATPRSSSRTSRTSLG